MENIICIISVLLMFNEAVLWPGMRPLLENVPCALEKNAYSAVFCGVCGRYLLGCSRLWDTTVNQTSISAPVGSTPSPEEQTIIKGDHKEAVMPCGRKGELAGGDWEPRGLLF